jgi:GNAT superfamily N-acetyltransferase
MEIVRLQTPIQLADFIYLLKDYVSETKLDTELNEEEYINQIYASVTNRGFIVNLAYEDKKLVGFLTLRFRFANKEVHLEDFYVKPEYRKQGIGKELLWSLQANGEEIAFQVGTRRLYFKSISYPLRFWLMFTKGIKIREQKRYYFTLNDYLSWREKNDK